MANRGPQTSWHFSLLGGTFLGCHFAEYGCRTTHPLVADELLVADGLVGLEGGEGAGGGEAVAEADVAAPVVLAALVARLERALVRAARALGG